MYERQALIFQISSLFQTFYPLSFEEGQTSWEREGVHPHCRPASPFVVHGWRSVCACIDISAPGVRHALRACVCGEGMDNLRCLGQFFCRTRQDLQLCNANC